MVYNQQIINSIRSNNYTIIDNRGFRNCAHPFMPNGYNDDLVKFFTSIIIGATYAGTADYYILHNSRPFYWGDREGIRDYIWSIGKHFSAGDIIANLETIEDC